MSVREDPLPHRMCRHPRELKGQFSIKGGSIQESTAKKEFVFDVKCEDNGETLTLAASSAAEKSKWILAIVAAAAAVPLSDQEYSESTSPGSGHKII